MPTKSFEILKEFNFWLTFKNQRFYVHSIHTLICKQLTRAESQLPHFERGGVRQFCTAAFTTSCCLTLSPLRLSVTELGTSLNFQSWEYMGSNIWAVDFDSLGQGCWKPWCTPRWHTQGYHSCYWHSMAQHASGCLSLPTEAMWQTSKKRESETR